MKSLLRKSIMIVLAIVVITSLLVVMTSCNREKYRGEQGLPGANGLTPFIGENGNWWIGDTDTGVAAAARDGRDGKDGKDGVDGIDGTDGATGKDGAAGKDGVDGTDGVSVSSLEINDRGELIVHFSDSTFQNLGKFVPEDGKDGENGNIIAKTEVINNSLIITLDDGTVIDVGRVRGEDGAAGTDGIDGIDGVSPILQIDSKTSQWMVSYDNGATWEPLGCSAKGIGIVDMKIEDGHLFVKYENSLSYEDLGKICDCDCTGA